MPNAAPTSDNVTLTGVTEDTARVIASADFPFTDADLETLQEIQITTLPTAGTLKLNGVDVTLNQVISLADLDAGLLVYLPASNTYGNGLTGFGFKVSDGTEFSAAAYSLTLDVTGVPDDETITGTSGNDTLNGDLIDAEGTDTIYGGAGDDSLNGLLGNDVLFGEAGNDALDGGAGDDSLSGGLGDDSYVVDSLDDQIIESFDEGTDSVQSSVNWILGDHQENLTLTGTAINGFGNELNNLITGNASNNLLNGGLGDDTLIGGLGNDTYVVDNVLDVVTELSDQGTDTVQTSITWTLGDNLENLTLTGSGAANGTGNTLNNVLTGNTNANILDGGAGDDTLIGGASNDTYLVDSIGDVVTELSSQGTDTVSASLDWTLGSNLENLTLTGTAISGTGNTLNNVLTGNASANSLSGGAGNDTLNGGAGNDTLTGGTGDDTYVVDSASDVITELSGEGTDTVQSSLTYTLDSSNLENLTLTGATVINGTGNTADNVLTGNSAANVLDGGAGNDSMIGGTGNDTYIVDSTSDVVTETSSLSTELDSVTASVNWTLGNNVENLTLTGAAISGTGNTLANVLTGNANANALIGNAGNDTLDGAAGADTLTGGLGDDTYVVDDLGDVITEASAEGTDTVRSSLTYTLGANVEKLTLTGSNAINGTGNTLANTLTGNGAANLLDGGSGADSLIGGAGNDTYVVDNVSDLATEALNEGTDTVQSSVTLALGSNLENLTLTGVAAINGSGNTLDNTLTGNSAANTLNGGIGNDTLIGGLGNDTYVVDSTLDVVTEALNEGTDTVQSALTWTLGSNLENLTLTGASAINGTGNALANTLTGNTAANTLDGGTGDDTLIGGAGNDIYIVDSTLDVVTEAASAGTDSVQSSATFTLSANVESLTLTGASAINGTGNTLDNTLTGNTAANTLDGGTGNDTLIGGLGNDTYVVDSTLDVVTEALNEGTDTVQSARAWTLGSNLENLTLTGAAVINGTGNTLANTLTGNSAANVLDGGTGNDSLIGGLGNDTYVVDSISDLISETSSLSTEIDSVSSSVNWTLGANLEKLTLTGAAVINGTGNTLANTLTGNSAANVLDGGAGIDTLIGGLGNDTYVVDNTADVISETSALTTEIDSVQSSATFTLGAYVENLTLTGAAAINGTGNTLANTLTGNSAANVLNGGTGIDTLIGGLGNDTYVVDNAADVISETSTLTTEIDSVQSSLSWSLGANLEKLTLTGASAINGTGNTLANTLTGNSAANVLNGGTGNDTLIGGLGNDTYIVDSISDLISETSTLTTEIDSVSSSVNWTLGANLEKLTLTGAAVINGTGNTLANTLTGNSAANVLNGGAGIDTLIGGLGNDTYVVDNTADVISETSALTTEIDSVQSSATFTLGANLENLMLTGAAVINGTGNTLANTLTGNSAANVLSGGTGIDTLIGGLGNDTYVVDNAADVISETSTLTTEIDSVSSSVNWTLGANLEKLTLTGAAVINGTGNTLANTLTGNSAANVLNGGTGIDTLIGGLGNDTYVVDNAADVISETSAVTTEIDTVQSSVSWTLGGNLENLTLTGAAASNGTGNGLNNTIIGNSAANVLTGGIGLDKLTGGSGADRFDFNAFSEMGVSTLRDVINDFKTAEADKIDLSTLDANLVTTGDQAFTFIGTTAFSATDATGQVRFANGILYGSNDADATAEFEIQLIGVTTLGATDLIA
ncbi:calcium-binding protein [Pseudomonas sp. 2FG]|uniref:beta strand repeat-containing protein n=1 Tax=Pseudomonas sp. 2FG TaxID=2502191 RepID=UPI0010F7EA20|nr:calcium-binding protein [Pseudomonas sp. 2FG]